MHPPVTLRSHVSHVPVPRGRAPPSPSSAGRRSARTMAMVACVSMDVACVLSAQWWHYRAPAVDYPLPSKHPNLDPNHLRRGGRWHAVAGRRGAHARLRAWLLRVDAGDAPDDLAPHDGLWDVAVHVVGVHLLVRVPQLEGGDWVVVPGQLHLDPQARVDLGQARRPEACICVRACLCVTRPSPQWLFMPGCE